jgi:hypothetical protein
MDATGTLAACVNYFVAPVDCYSASKSASPGNEMATVWRLSGDCLATVRAADRYIDHKCNVSAVLPNRYIPFQMECICFPALWEMGLLTRLLWVVLYSFTVFWVIWVKLSRPKKKFFWTKTLK